MIYTQPHAWQLDDNVMQILVFENQDKKNEFDSKFAEQVELVGLEMQVIRELEQSTNSVRFEMLINLLWRSLGQEQLVLCFGKVKTFRHGNWLSIRLVKIFQL